ncbi:MAG: hypothetical protein E3J83_05310 [Candidatus Atribacteria bacterium]|nr:MAG: hypothetical protein E3J83_05310 [Candidatus Atribacteria bacterium]
MSALEKIIEWASTLPAWESDAIRRMLTQSDFTDKDTQDIIDFLKKDHGLIKNGKDISTPKRIESGNISGVPQTGINISLKSIKCISGVNAIPDNSILPLSSNGLNVIYGDNATGKSGYVRVLKKACRARDTEEDILNNVFSENDKKVMAAFKINLDGEDKIINWENGEESKDELSNINVFDTKCARIIIDKKNNAQYLPYGTHVFEKLVEVLESIKNKLEQEKPLSEKPEIDEIDINTKAGKFYNEINIKSKKNDIEINAKWNESDEKKLKKLNKEIINIENNDPLKQAKKIRNIRERIKKLAKYLLNIRIGLSNKLETNIKEHIKLLAVAEKALEEASKLSLSNEPLRGAGSSAWQSLYNAAKKYSIEHAYPRKDFPNLEDNSLCVLCMQPIKDNDVKLRFERFKKFMEDTTKKDVEKVKEKLNTIRQLVDQIQFYDDEVYSDVFQEISEEDEDLPGEIKTYLSLLKARKEDILKSIDNKKYTSLITVGNYPKRKIYNIYIELGKEAKKLEESADPDKLEKMKSYFNELKSRKLLSKNKKEVLKYLDALKKEEKYNKCLKEIKTRTRNITTKGRDIVSEALSPQLEKALKDELKQLGGSRFPVFFKVTGEKGTTEHQLRLKGIKTDRRVLLRDILCEGEQKVIAIAGFLAELKTSNQKNPIVFDDPVCSLDHRFRRSIAERLVIESKERQVIVFTHDLSFLMMLQEFSDKSDNEISIKSIERTVSTPGICSDYMPWDAMNVKERVKILKEKCDKLKEIHEKMLESEYNEKAGLLYGNIRETWERLVEELLLNGIVYRFGRDVQTKRLKRVVDISEDDYNKVYNAMEKCSNYLRGHDKAAELHQEMPKPAEIMNDIKEIEEYRKELVNKRKRGSRS